MSKFKAIWKKCISRKYFFENLGILILPITAIVYLVFSLIFRHFSFLLLLFIVIGFVLVCIIRILLAPFVGLNHELRVNILEKLIPEIRKSSDSVTTLSSVAILLTFSVIQFLGIEVSYKDNLIISWYLFFGSIVIGVIIGIMIYVFKPNYLVLISRLQDPNKNKSEENKKRTETLLNKTYKIVEAIFICASLQLLTFFGAMMYAIVFMIKNIY